jgi:cyclic beta-1,2-glucan synthetase
VGAQDLQVQPCLPSHWPRAEITLTRDGRRMHFVLVRGAALGLDALALEPPGGGAWLLPGQTLRWIDHGADSRFVVPLPN